MATLPQFVYALNANDNAVRENASRVLLNEFSKRPSELPLNVLASVANRLGDSSALVRNNVARFLYFYVKSGRTLGQVWLNLAVHLKSNDANVKTYLVQALNFLGKDEHILQKVVDNFRINPEMRMRAAEALAHFYDRKGYLSSVSDLLQKDFYTIRGTLTGIYVDRQMRLINEKDLLPIEPKITRAMEMLKTGRKQNKDIRREPVREKPREYRPMSRV
jgi:predicted transcriptional regulator with HTH domain